MLSNLLSNLQRVKNGNAKNADWILSKKLYFFNFKFTEAKFLYIYFWLNLIVCNSALGRYW